MNVKRQAWGSAAGLMMVAAVLIISGGSPDALAQEPRFDGMTVRIATWGGSKRDAIHELIGKELERHGAKVAYVIGNTRDNLAKLIAARGREAPFDVMEIDDAIRPQLVEGHFLKDLDYGNLPNSRELDAAERDRTMVATTMTEEGVVYNVKKFAELGIPKPEHFSDLLNPKLAGRLSFPDINVGIAMNGIVGSAIEAGGDEANLDPGLALIRKLKLASFYKSSVELATLFNSGDIWAAWWHAGWALRLREAGVPVGMAYQKVRNKYGMVAFNWAGVPKGSKVRRAAEFAINRYLDPDVQVGMAKKTGLMVHSKEAMARLAKDPAFKGLVFLSPAEIRNMYYIDWSKMNLNDLISKWNRTMAR